MTATEVTGSWHGAWMVPRVNPEALRVFIERSVGEYNIC